MNDLAKVALQISSGKIKVIDLTQTLSPDFPSISLPPEFGQAWPFRIEEVSRYDERGPAWYWNNFSCGEHTGTHFDAPIHWVSGKDLPNNATDTIPPRKFIGQACVIDLTSDVERNPDFLLTAERIQAWEQENGQIPAGAWVLLRTGWSKRTSKEEFLNAGEGGAHSPGFAPECSQWLATQRDILGVGVETVGTDAGQAGGFTPPFPNHNFMHGNGRFGITSLINLDQLPTTGAVVIAAPLKIVGGSGSPLRVIAIAPA